MIGPHQTKDRLSAPAPALIPPKGNNRDIKIVQAKRAGKSDEIAACAHVRKWLLTPSPLGFAARFLSFYYVRKLLLTYLP